MQGSSSEKGSNFVPIRFYCCSLWPAAQQKRAFCYLLLRSIDMVYITQHSQQSPKYGGGAKSVQTKGCMADIQKNVANLFLSASIAVVYGLQQ